MRTVGSVVSIVAVSLALGLLALAPLGWRLGWWSYGFALLSIIPLAGAMAAIAVAVSLLTLALARAQLGRPTFVALLAVLAVGAGLVYLPLRYERQFRTFPPINDISTDTDNRPAFEAALAARAAEDADRSDTPDPELSELQRAGYPDIVPVRSALPAGEAFSKALAVAQAMRGWTIVVVDRDKGRIEASARTFWFGFTDDIVIRVTADGGGSRIDMRSASRIGGSDIGVNAARIRAYMRAVSQAVGQ
ncbi:MAG: DUF1499 domain-containing protein [Hyphomicrobiaceae bacterium]